MATVRINDTIRQHVREKITALFETRRAEIRNIKRNPQGNLAIYEYLLADFRNRTISLDNLLPFESVGERHIVQKHPRPTAFYHSAELSMVYTLPAKPIHEINLGPTTTQSITLKLPEPLPMPFKNESRAWGHITTPASFYLSPELIAAVPEAENLYKALLEELQIKEEEATLHKHLVEGVLRRCTTLRQVLEAWPLALDFMPPEVVERHHKKDSTTKKNKDVDLQNVVSDEVKLTLTKARMMQG